MEPTALILSSDYARLGHDTRSLARKAAAGELRRIRQGVYAPAREWDALAPWERYPLLIHAAAATLRTPTVFCRQSAAALWGSPLLGRPSLVHACTSDGGGGRSRAGVRRHRTDMASLPVEERCGLLVTSRLRTALDLAAYESFGQAVMSFDHVLKPDPAHGLGALSRADLEGSLGKAYSAAAERRIRTALALADPASGSPGESLSRAFMQMEGICLPRLQSEVRDAHGFVAYCDFEWPEEGIVGEFDGMVKYRKTEYLKGRTPSDIVVEEKRREDRIRGTGRRVIRWTWSELASPRQFAAFLAGAGVPRVRRASSRR
ncbi:MAG: hypothetical protein JWO29_1210 [Arthrobacter sp.]|nr:hypothetical protein [Arthrobacter sp.]